MSGSHEPFGRRDGVHPIAQAGRPCPAEFRLHIVERVHAGRGKPTRTRISEGRGLPPSRRPNAGACASCAGRRGVGYPVDFRGPVRPGDGHSAVAVVRQMRASRIVVPVALMGRLLGFSDAGYHARRQREPSVRIQLADPPHEGGATGDLAREPTTRERILFSAERTGWYMAWIGRPCGCLAADRADGPRSQPADGQVEDRPHAASSSPWGAQCSVREATVILDPDSTATGPQAPAALHAHLCRTADSRRRPT